MTFFDTHAHLNDVRFAPDREAVLARALAGGVARLVEIADSPSEWEPAIALSRARPKMVRCSLGLHPICASQWEDSIAETLPRKAALPEVVAIGEIGLDYVRSEVPKEVQKEVFRKMLALALRCDRPVVIHCREAYPDLLPILEEFYADGGEDAAEAVTGRFRGVLHCFSAGKDEAQAGVRLGFALGVDGPITYPKNNALREAIRSAGLDHIVLETDSPYLPPQSSRGKRNEPSAIPEIAQAVAALYGVPPEAVASATTRNAEDLFRLSAESPPPAPSA